MKDILDKIKIWLIAFLNECKNIKKIGINTFVKKRRYELIIIFLLLLFVILLPLSIGENNTSIDVINKFQQYVSENNISKLSKIMRVDNKQVDKERLVPITTYYLENNEEFLQIINGLKKQGKSGLFSILEEKNTFKSNYYINLESLTVKFKLADKNTTLFLNGKEIMGDKVQKNFIPGRYAIKYSIKTAYGEVSEEKIVDIFQNEEIPIAENICYITLYSNFDDAEVYINNELLEKKSGQIKNFGPIPINKNVEMYLKRDFPWGTIVSDTVKITDDNYIKLDINMVNEELMNNVTNTVNEFYNSSFNALNEKDISMIKFCNENSKNKVYNYINEKALVFTNNYEINDLEVKIEKSEFKFENDDYKASIYTVINYNVYKKLMPFIKSGYDGKFLLSLKYSDEQWIIEDIQKFDDQ